MVMYNVSRPVKPRHLERSESCNQRDAVCRDDVKKVRLKRKSFSFRVSSDDRCVCLYASACDRCSFNRFNFLLLYNTRL